MPIDLRLFTEDDYTRLQARLDAAEAALNQHAEMLDDQALAIEAHEVRLLDLAARLTALEVPVPVPPPPPPPEPPPSSTGTEIGPGADVAAAIAALPSTLPVLIFRGGVYPGFLVTRPGVTLLAKAGEQPIIKGIGGCGVAILTDHVTVSGLDFDGSAAADHALCIKGTGAHHVTVENSAIYGAPRSGLIVFQGAHTFTGRNLHLHDNGVPTSSLEHGIYLTGADHLLEDVLAERNSGYGVHLFAPSNPKLHRTVLRRVVARQNWAGINVGNGDDIRLEDCRAENSTHYDGLMIHDTNRLLVQRPILVGNKRAGAWVQPSALGTRIESPTWSGNGGGNIVGTAVVV
jgi:hypothetical protein